MCGGSMAIDVAAGRKPNPGISDLLNFSHQLGTQADPALTGWLGQLTQADTDPQQFTTVAEALLKQWTTAH